MFVLCLSLSLSLSVSLSVSVYVCVVCCCGARGCLCGGGGGRRRRGETNRTIWAKVSLKIAGVEQPYQVKRMTGGIEAMWLYVITIRGQILVSRTGDDTLVHVQKRPRTHGDVLNVHMETFGMYIRRCF